MTAKLAVALLGAGLLARAQVYGPAKEGGNYMHNYYLPPAPSTTPWAPCWSPDGRWIAVAMHGSIWKVDPRDGSATELTHNARYHSSPAWSPDGNWIVYTADDAHKRIQLEILELASGRTHVLTDDSQIYLDPTFAPDGTRLAYVSTRPNGHFNIYVRPIREGRWAGEEVALTMDHRYARSRLYFGIWDMHTQPAWTPDGKEIVFVTNRDVPLGAGDVWRMPAEPDGMRKGSRILREQSLYRTRPDVSPDGTRFVYSSSAGAADQYNHLYVLPVAGGAPYKLTFGDYDEFHPRWSPDGNRIAYISNQGGLPQLWVLEAYGGGRKKIEISKLDWKQPMGRLHVRVLDAAGSPAEARIQGLAADGRFCAPSDAYARIGVYGQHFFHTTGEFTMTVPPGRMTLEAIEGFENIPAREEVDILAGRTAEAVLRLKRLVDQQSRGCYSGSTHVHMNYGGNLHNTLENVMMMAHAEGMSVVCDLVANKDNRIFDWQYFVPGGGEHPVSKNDPRLKVIVGEEYRPPFQGHMGFIGLRDHLISPFTTGYEGTAIASLYPNNTDMLRQARAEGAFTSYVHAMSGDRDPVTAELGVAKTFPVDAALGTVDAIEWSSSTRAQLRVWHHALNCDLPVTPVGGEDSISNLQLSKIVGSLRTYVWTGGDLRVDSWLENLKKGHTFFTSGPLLDLRINDRLPGDVIRLASPGAVRIHAEVHSIVPLNKVVLYRNGKVFREFKDKLDEQVPVSESGWFSLYAEGPAHRYLDINYPQAATNAIRVYVGDGKIRDRESAEYFIRWIDKLRGMMEAWPWWRTPAETRHVLGQLEEARKVYQRLAEGKD